jgi:hypothetical protein
MTFAKVVGVIAPPDQWAAQDHDALLTERPPAGLDFGR